MNLLKGGILIKTLVSSFIFLFLTANAQAQFERLQPGPPNVRVELDGAFGDGCSSESISTSLSPDLASLTVLFTDFYTEIPAALAPSAAKKTCLVRLKFFFTGQYRIAVTGSDLRAFVSLPQNSGSRMTVKHHSIYMPNLKVQQKMNLIRDLAGPMEGPVQLTSDFSKTPLWSSCGSQGGARGFNLMQIEMVIESQNNNNQADLFAGIDSLDLNFNTALKYNIAYVYDRKSCPR